ncbi:DUF4143 domain-containing protein [Corynebacterium cystitidis]|uniref:DUF4143 domain-containing protein n=1 Tax=Corynebacterium cystitidis TaxID=35757 RepID=UPI0027BA7062|nr:DUF4143 domain-containing protein [Corynebacterium cystitidis]
MLKQQAWSDTDFRIFHFRQSTGPEVDLVLETKARRVIGIEVKAAVSISAKDFTGLQRLQQIARDNFQLGIVLYTGTDIIPSVLRVEVTMQLLACRSGFSLRNAYFHSVTSTLSVSSWRAEGRRN